MKIPKDGVFVIGAGGHSKVVISTLQAVGYNVKCILDDDKNLWGKYILGHKIEGPVSELSDIEQNVKAVIAIGNNAIRKKIAESFHHLEWINAIHPDTTIHPTVKIGKGTVIFAGSVIQPDTKIGNHCIINTSSSVDHDCEIKDFVHVAPGCHLAGGINLDEGSFLGIGCKLIPGVTLGKWATCGAGSVVIKDIPDHKTVVGIPAKEIHKKSKNEVS